jgi:hypothetical protein
VGGVLLLLRRNLKATYLRLKNLEKNNWAINAGYSGYNGLYRYLGSDPDKPVKDEVINALKYTVGNDRFNELTSSYADINISANDNTNTVERLVTIIKSTAVNNIPCCIDAAVLQELKQVLEVVSGITTNQLNYLELANRIR